MFFEVGRIYNRKKDIHAKYGGDQQGGISTPAKLPVIFVFTGKSGEKYGYKDDWNTEGVFLYTGAGRIGDMKFVRGNLAIRDHSINGKSLHLFESQKKGQGYRYLGEFICSTWEYRKGVDSTGTERNTILFHLLPISDLQTLEGDVKLDEHEITRDELELLKSSALAAATSAPEGSEKSSKRIIYERCQLVRRYVLARSKGLCESCKQPAPFIRKNNTPYLEPHHTRRVSDGGPDHPSWVGAICPNCHAEIHFGFEGEAKNKALQDYLRQLN